MTLDPRLPSGGAGDPQAFLPEGAEAPVMQEQLQEFFRQAQANAATQPFRQNMLGNDVIVRMSTFHDILSVAMLIIVKPDGTRDIFAIQQDGDIVDARTVDTDANEEEQPGLTVPLQLLAEVNAGLALKTKQRPAA